MHKQLSNGSTEQMKAKRQALGKGLAALIPKETGPLPGKKSQAIFWCPVEELSPNQQQPRQSFDDQKLRELTESVREKGILQPLIVREKEGRFVIVAGERRWRAAKLAGLPAVPVLVKEVSTAEMLELALIENIQREDLNPIEEAEAYYQLMNEYGFTQEELSKRVGKQRSSVANMLRLLKLPKELRTYLLTGELSMGHARAILGVVGNHSQLQLAKKVVKEKLSVRETEELVRQAPGTKKSANRKTIPRKYQYSPVEYRLIEALQERMATKVDLRKSGRGGKLIIHYYSPEELDRLFAIIRGN